MAPTYAVHGLFVQPELRMSKTCSKRRQNLVQNKTDVENILRIPFGNLGVFKLKFFGTMSLKNFLIAPFNFSCTFQFSFNSTFTFFGAMTLFKIFFFVFENFSMSPKGSPSIFVIFCNRKNVKKYQMPPFTLLS